MPTPRIDRVHTLFDYLVAHPDGRTIYEMAHDLDWSVRSVRSTIRPLRLALGDGDTINVPAEPQGKNQPWRYRLVGQFQDGSPWLYNRLADAESRLETMQAAATSWTASSDGRTTDGKKARVIARGVTRILEDLAEIRTGDG